jgi:DNA adenine methylase
LKLPHPIPYQGSKRRLAGRILSVVAGRRFRRLYEPLAGSAAVTIAAAKLALADGFVIGDSFEPLTEIWRLALADHAALADRYQRVWSGQERGGAGYYDLVRARYNRGGDPALLLYLLVRCVKNSPRFNQSGAFNQGVDRRRLGMRPDRMRAALRGAAVLLGGRTRVVCGDFVEVVAAADRRDLVYLDPPWQGTTQGRDKRYHQGLGRERLLGALAELTARRVPFLLSYDGRCGARSYGSPLPPQDGVRYEMDAGRSSQATLNGTAATTVESLYVSRLLMPRRPRPPAA